MESDITATDEGRGRFTYHGGDLAAARSAYPGAPEPWVDLSTGINPIPYAVPSLPMDAWAALPSAAAARALEAAAARAYGAEPDNIVGAPGTEALIQWLPRLHRARRVGVLGFTYGDHARSWRSAGAEVDVVDDLAALEGYDVAVVVNPNNPDGRLVEPDALVRLARRVGLLVVDEAFADVVSSDWSLATRPPPNGLVLRSFGKFFGLAGLRLGFAVTATDRATSLRAAFGPWAVSGPAVAVGTRAFADDVWASSSLTRLAQDAGRLDVLLRDAGAVLVGGTTLYRLAEFDDAAGTFDALAHAGLLTRPFAERPRWLRFGLPVDEAAWQRLSGALRR
ncbi:threonine-phosphate decarboxylase CobD [Lichenibacterium ramalinae]|uniref:threonine-phosphate decarboxylase n=1 Tax=Lichenibacterium ramalinae TaxID=2316527 RepID=A0A4Q2REC4_9HYPH|nr:threonine-phosphate decarboxylase CobD [Lichenibacterium ramalinae]RYB04408.1 threonine-phosphate decarboxylase [Lichenibacterium ramalinae]